MRLTIVQGTEQQVGRAAARERLERRADLGSKAAVARRIHLHHPPAADGVAG